MYFSLFHATVNDKSGTATDRSPLVFALAPAPAPAPTSNPAFWSASSDRELRLDIDREWSKMDSLD